MEWLFLIPIGYQFVALIACIKRMFQTKPVPEAMPPISILKPVRGAELFGRIEDVLGMARSSREAMCMLSRASMRFSQARRTSASISAMR